MAAGTPLAEHGRARALVEAASGGQLGSAVRSLPGGLQHLATTATRQGFLDGLNEILLIGGGVALAGAVLSLILVREGEIERDALEEPVASEVLQPTPA